MRTFRMKVYFSPAARMPLTCCEGLSEPRPAMIALASSTDTCSQHPPQSNPGPNRHSAGGRGGLA